MRMIRVKLKSPIVQADGFFQAPRAINVETTRVLLNLGTQMSSIPSGYFYPLRPLSHHKHVRKSGPKMTSQGRESWHLRSFPRRKRCQRKYGSMRLNPHEVYIDDKRLAAVANLRLYDLITAAQQGKLWRLRNCSPHALN